VAFVHKLTGHRPHLSTLHRWALKGRLAVHRVGCKVFTTKTALRELLEADASRPPATRDRREVERRGLEAAARIAGKPPEATGGVAMPWSGGAVRILLCPAAWCCERGASGGPRTLARFRLRSSR